MTDKENNFAKDINVPSKEQIIIDGVDVSECENYRYKDMFTCYPYICNCHQKPNCHYKQLTRKTQECEQKDERIIELTKEYQRLKGQKDKADKTISDLIGCVSLWEEFTEEESKLAKDSSIADLIMLLREKRRECEELKKANQHIDANRQCKGSKLKRIEELISACEAGYTDEFIQKIYGIIQESEPTINDYSIIDRYRKALEEIEEYCNNVLSFTAVRTTESDILDIVNKAKGEGNDT